MCDIRELDQLDKLAALEERERKATANLPGYLGVVREWTRCGKPGTLPSPLPYGLMLCDVTTELGQIDAGFREQHGLSNWNFYNPDYHFPMMEIRQNAVELGLDPDAAAAEFTAASKETWNPTLTKRRAAILADYRHAIYDKRQKTGQPSFQFVLCGHEDRKAKSQPGAALLFNPYAHTGASRLLRVGEPECCFAT